MKNWFVALLFITSCNEQSKIYTIQKGQHDSGSRVIMITKDQIKFRTQFDNSAIYNTQDPVNQADINKLYGFSDCDSTHQDNSARFGWRWFNNELQIHAYVYTHGQRESKFLKAVALNTSHNYELRIIEDTYEFTLDNVKFSMPRGCGSPSILKYRLFPYFGGNEVAPHNIKIVIAE